MLFIHENTSREELETAAREAGLPILEDTTKLRHSIVAWIEAGDECGAENALDDFNYVGSRHHY
jgi:hypothetical protein